MASIDKLAIRGIRAFDPGHEETIQIYTPLTMIVGSNGCGKTTIIECLKYTVLIIISIVAPPHLETPLSPIGRILSI